MNFELSLSLSLSLSQQEKPTNCGTEAADVMAKYISRQT